MRMSFICKQSPAALGGRADRSELHLSYPENSMMLRADEGKSREEALICRIDGGSAILCGCCGCVELTLGNAVLSLDRDDLESMIQLLTEFELEREDPGALDGRCFTIRTPNDSAAFIFSRREIRSLRRMVIVCQRYVAARPEVMHTRATRSAASMLGGSLRLLH